MHAGGPGAHWPARQHGGDLLPDHGEMLGDHGLTAKGGRFYEGAVRVPLVISWLGRFRRWVVANDWVEPASRWRGRVAGRFCRS